MAKLSCSIPSLGTNEDLSMKDDYPTCAKTDALLRIFSEDITPDEISNILCISPTEVKIKGELRNPGKLKSINKVQCRREMSAGHSEKYSDKTGCQKG